MFNSIFFTYPLFLLNDTCRCNESQDSPQALVDTEPAKPRGQDGPSKSSGSSSVWPTQAGEGPTLTVRSQRNPELIGGCHTSTYRSSPHRALHVGKHPSITSCCHMFLGAIVTYSLETRAITGARDPMGCLNYAFHGAWHHCQPVDQ
jgi:hypothetical protein